MYLFLFVSSFLFTNAADSTESGALRVSEQIEDAHLTYCNTDSKNCYEAPYYDGQDYTTNDLEFVGAYTDGHSCCYKYVSTYSGRQDCSGDSSKQPSLLLGYICDKDKHGSLKISDGTGQLMDDESMCMHGIAFDDVDSKGRSKTHIVCIAWDLYAYEEPQCCTGEGFYATKSRKTHAFSTVQVPKCSCQTEEPTRRPTPTEKPTTTTTTTKSPTTAKPTTFYPTISRTTKSPTRRTTTARPTARPTTTTTTKRPTDRPTLDCKPIVKVFVNEDCQEKDFVYGDVDVHHAPVMEYKDPGMVGDPITDKPQDSMAVKVLHAVCDDPYGNNYYPDGYFEDDDGYSTGMKDFYGKPYYEAEADPQHAASLSSPAHFPAEQNLTVQSEASVEESSAPKANVFFMIMITAMLYGVIATCMYCKARFSNKKNWNRDSREDLFTDEDE